MGKIIIKNNKINWICLGKKCPKNCCGQYITNPSQESVWRVEEKEIPLTPKDFQRLIKQNLSKYLVKKEDNGWYIHTHRDGTCPLLKNGKCSIYSNRPSTCKSYPFFFSKYNGLYADLNCPGWGKGWTKLGKIKQMIKELIKIYKWQIKKTEKNFLIETFW
jgi:Fe-S-cluster containining protein